MEFTENLMSMAYHEAGHAVAAYQFTMKPKPLTIIDKGHVAGKCTHARCYSENNLNEYKLVKSTAITKLDFENNVFVSLAGPLAQMKYNPWVFKQVYAQSDYHQALDLLSIIEEDDEVLELYFDLIDLRARKFIESKANWKAISHLAKAVLDQPKLSGHAVKRAIQEGYCLD